MSLLTNRRRLSTKRWYGGCENVDTVKSPDRRKRLFGAEHVSVTTQRRAGKHGRLLLDPKVGDRF